MWKFEQRHMVPKANSVIFVFYCVGVRLMMLEQY